MPARPGAHFFLIVGREMARHASFGIGFVPWIAVLAVGVGRKSSPESRIAAAVAIGFVLSMVVVYVRAPQDPTLWILWSAGRLFMTPLLCAFFAAAARYPPEPDLAQAAQPGSATTTA